MRALQDPGETPKPKKHANKTGTSASASSSSRTNDGVVIVYPKLMKALAGVQRTLQTKYAHHGIPKHPTDCRKQRALACIRSRKSQDKAVVPDEFRKFAIEGSDTISLLITN